MSNTLKKYITLLKTISYINFQKRYKYIKNYIKIHKKEFKCNPKQKVINNNILLFFGKAKSVIFIDYKNDIGIICGFFLLEKLKNGIIIFVSEDEINNEQYGKISNYIYEKYKINQLFFLNKIPVSKNIYLKKGPIIQISDKTPPCKKFLEKLQQIIEKSKINVQYSIRKNHNKNFKIFYSPYFFDTFFMGIPFAQKYSYNAKDIHSLFMLSYYCLSYL
jgi:hypothetical protein